MRIFGKDSFLALAAIAALANCGGGGGGGNGGGTGPGIPVASPSSSPTPVPTPNLVVDSIAAMNAAGSPVAADQDLETAQSSPKARSGNSAPSGTCTALGNAGYEFFIPDRAGDTNSTERVVFYDAACTKPATDAVRIFTPLASGSETVTRTVSRYSQTGALYAQRSETVQYSNGNFDSFGYPVVDTGLVRNSTANYSLTPPNGKTFTMTENDEFIVASLNSPQLQFCSDTAAVNALGNFGIQAQTDPSEGTITTNADGSVTFQMTRLGYAYSGSGLSIAQGAPNTACPVSTPQYSVNNGNSRGQYAMPITIQIANINNTAIPTVVAMTVTNASFPNGETLNVSTTSAPNATPVTIVGTLTNANGTVATFTVDGTGTGTLTVTSTGTTYPVVAWHVAS